MGEDRSREAVAPPVTCLASKPARAAAAPARPGVIMRRTAKAVTAVASAVHAGGMRPTLGVTVSGQYKSDITAEPEHAKNSQC